ncbi:MAG: gamma-glutamyl-gamma-aminobutyrate hydrolase family protein [Dehalococcoidia bacterium]|nr:gamma-glutamyl-gamma-aminobutyrate hydrolase family protein [Dehalococcoidia bacterium]
MTDRPRVLITRAEDVLGEDWDDYARCIDRAGGEPVAFDCASFTTVEALPPFEGLIVTAGVDVDPAAYGQAQSDRVTVVNPDRDRVESALIRFALAGNVPLFAICRGFQLLNVVHGGSLLQHIEEREPHRARRAEDGVTIASGWHEVAVRPGSLLAAATGEEILRVNSRHHQAVLPGGLGADLLATGMAPDGVVEATEAPGHTWALGVQWHPERPEMAEMTDSPALRSASTALFEAFVAACREAAG